MLSSALSQQCYSESGCAGVPFAVNSAKECCVGTDNGHSYADGNGTCIISQCTGTPNNNSMGVCYSSSVYSFALVNQSPMKLRD